MKIRPTLAALPANQVLHWLVGQPGGTARYRDIGPACGIGMRGGAVAAACRALERCGWVEVREPHQYASARQRLARSDMTVTATPAGRLWAAYLRRLDQQPLDRLAMFARMCALEDAIAPLAELGVKARQAGATDRDTVRTELPARHCLLAAEIMFPPPGRRPTIYPWTPGSMDRKYEILGNEQPKK